VRRRRGKVAVVERMDEGQAALSLYLAQPVDNEWRGRSAARSGAVPEERVALGARRGGRITTTHGAATWRAARHACAWCPTTP